MDVMMAVEGRFRGVSEGQRGPARERGGMTGPSSSVAVVGRQRAQESPLTQGELVVVVIYIYICMYVCIYTYMHM